MAKVLNSFFEKRTLSEKFVTILIAFTLLFYLGANLHMKLFTSENQWLAIAQFSSSVREVLTGRGTISASENKQKYIQYFVPVTHFGSLKNSTDLADLQSTTNIYFLKKDQTKLEQILLRKLDQAYSYETVIELINVIQINDIALISLGDLEPELKVLKLGETSLISEEADKNEWPLKVATKLKTIDPNNMQTVILTGVTAISRGVESAIAQHQDPTFPSLGVMDLLKAANITHVNSENPFFDSCKPKREGVVLCGKTASIEALKAIGTDVVDLAGNHQNDYGHTKNLESIQHLTDAGFQYFGGGIDEEDASKVLYIEVENTTYAFIGFAYFDSLNGPTYRSLAYKSRPGSNYYSKEKLEQSISEARENADVVIVDYQFIEDYSYTPLPGQIKVFRETIDLGADIVVGVQAHQPQKIEIYKGKPIFYGLGNFFFDQMWSLPTRQGIIPRLIFSNGKLVSIEIHTTLLHDFAQPRFTDGEERDQLLELVLPSDISSEEESL